MPNSSASLSCVPKCLTASDLVMPILSAQRYTNVKQEKGLADIECRETLSMTQLEQLGNKIRTLRKALGMRQVPFAKKVGISQGTLSDYEHGNFESPRADAIMRIAQLCKVDPLWLFFGEGMPGAAAARTEQEAVLLGLFRALDDAGRGFVIGSATTLVDRMGTSEHNPYFGIPKPGDETGAGKSSGRSRRK